MNIFTKEILNTESFKNKTKITINYVHIYINITVYVFINKHIYINVFINIFLKNLNTFNKWIIITYIFCGLKRKTNNQLFNAF